MFPNTCDLSNKNSHLFQKYYFHAALFSTANKGTIEFEENITFHQVIKRSVSQLVSFNGLASMLGYRNANILQEVDDITINIMFKAPKFKFFSK